MGPQFSQFLAYYDNTVIAMGPLGRDDTANKTPDYVEEIHAWIYQEASLTSHAAAMPKGAPGVEILQQPGKCWMVPLESVTLPTSPGFRAGRAFAVAIALFSNDQASPGYRPFGQKEGHVIWWGHPVYLLESDTAVQIATGPGYANNPGGAFDQITAELERLWDVAQAS
ncbi:MAG: hypothetical protein ACJ744_06015 [Gaiellaceae bacterium]|jgi:hypothetical protein